MIHHKKKKLLNQKQMSKGKIIKKDKTLIGSVIENSAEIVKANNVITLLSESLVAMAVCKYKPIDTSCIKATIKEYRRTVVDLKIHSTNQLKAFYTKDYVLINDGFHLSTAEMQLGFIFIYKKNYEGKNVRCVLFLSDVKPDLLDPVYEGQVKEYNGIIEEKYLPLCKPVWKPSSVKDLYLESLNKRLK